jgi:hypothetical protein
VELRDASTYAKREFDDLWAAGTELIPYEIKERGFQKSFLRQDITPRELYLRFLYETLKENIEYDEYQVEYDFPSDADHPQLFFPAGSARHGFDCRAAGNTTGNTRCMTLALIPGITGFYLPAASGNWKTPACIPVDEAHNFRNAATDPGTAIHRQVAAPVAALREVIEQPVQMNKMHTASSLFTLIPRRERHSKTTPCQG